MKSTKELLNEIKNTSCIAQYLKENKGEFKNRGLCDYLNQLLIEKNMERIDIIKNIGFSADYAYQIFNGRRSPSRSKILCVAFTMKLNLQETSKLLKLADCGELYPRSPLDSVIIFGIENKLTLQQVNELLYNLNICILE